MGYATTDGYGSLIFDMLDILGNVFVGSYGGGKKLVPTCGTV